MLPPELVFPSLSIYLLWYCMSVSAKVLLTASVKYFSAKTKLTNSFN